VENGVTRAERGAAKEVGMERSIAFTLNGKPAMVTTDDARPLLWVLRQDLGLTSTKFGCGEAHCGACTVIVDKRAVRSCSIALKEVEGKSVLTIEGLEKGERLHPIQQAFLKHHAFQCGYCTPGMILNAYALLLRTPAPTREQILTGMNRNLCRCGAQLRIVAAIQEAAATMKGGA
jgi:aerobic-type carbon monoxide dehydrogenase small subunit (CoxS/CutS family)